MNSESNNNCNTLGIYTIQQRQTRMYRYIKLEVTDSELHLSVTVTYTTARIDD